MSKKYLTVEGMIEILSKVENQKAKISVYDVDENKQAQILTKHDIKEGIKDSGYVYIVVDLKEQEN
jgi:hypothetical protein